MSLARYIASAILAWLYPPKPQSDEDRRAFLTCEYHRLKAAHLPREHVLQELRNLTNAHLAQVAGRGR